MQAVILIYNKPAVVIDVHELESVDAGDSIIVVRLKDNRVTIGYHIKFQTV